MGRHKGMMIQTGPPMQWPSLVTLYVLKGLSFNWVTAAWYFQPNLIVNNEQGHCLRILTQIQHLPLNVSIYNIMILLNVSVHNLPAVLCLITDACFLHCWAHLFYIGKAVSDHGCWDKRGLVLPSSTNNWQKVTDIFLSEMV